MRMGFSRMQFKLKYLLVLLTLLATVFAIYGSTLKTSEQFNKSVSEQKELVASFKQLMLGVGEFVESDPDIAGLVSSYLAKNQAQAVGPILSAESGGGHSSGQYKSIGFFSSASKYSTSRDYRISWPSSDQLADVAGNTCRFEVSFDSEVVGSESEHRISLIASDQNAKTQEIVSWLADQIESELGIIPTIETEVR